MKYFSQIYDTTQYYRDAILKNTDNKPWASLGVNKIDKYIYYSFTPFQGESLQMISITNNLAAVKYSEYFIYDEYQNLIYFIYECDEGGEFIIKFNFNGSEIINSSPTEILAENYFIDVNREFNPIHILEDAKFNLTNCAFLWGLPDYKATAKLIRAKFIEINNENNLTQKKSDEIIGYYKDNKLVKIVDNSNFNQEYYIDNGVLIFAFYPKTENSEDIRVYYYLGRAFRVMLGKEFLPKTGIEFHNIENDVLEKFQECKQKL